MLRLLELTSNADLLPVVGKRGRMIACCRLPSLNKHCKSVTVYGLYLSFPLLLIACSLPPATVSPPSPTLSPSPLVTSPWQVAKRRQTFPVDTSPIKALVTHPQADTVLIGTYDGKLVYWDYQRNQSLYQRQEVNGIEALAFTPNGQTFFTGDNDGIIKQWETATGRPLKTYKDHGLLVSSLQVSPDGKILASGSWDRSVKLWNIAKGRLSYTLKGHEDQVTSVAFSPDGKLLATGDYGGALRLWNVQTGKLHRIFAGHLSPISQVAFSPDGRFLVSASHDHTVKQWNAKSGQTQQILGGHADGVTNLSFSPDGKILVTTSVREEKVKFWQFSTGKRLNTLQNMPVSVMSFNAKGDILLMGDRLGQVQVWQP